ncbi:MAG: pilus assembly protein PilZ [Micavibrio sp.]|nr:pilus assembly protein PilZ [Micavibrio sp.]|tara:strand:- start:211 stop:594 length:384 start_codon:yes stop_codon:yes gene_type:complete
MLSTILDSLRISASNDDQHNLRTHPRREVDSCVAMIDGKIFPVKNWSNGGALLSGLEHTIGENDEKEITLKFKLSDRVMDITHTGKVLRKVHDKFAMKFAPLTQELEKNFQTVIDDYVTQEFVNSQA